MTTWSNTDKSSLLTVSGNTATHTGGGNSYGAVRSSTSKTAGKWVYRAVPLVSNPVEVGAGFGIATSNLNNWIGADGSSVGAILDGAVWTNGNPGPVWDNTPPASGLFLAIDADANPRTVRFSETGSAWSSPVSVAGMTGAVFAMASTYAANDSWTADFNPGGWTLAGYSAWDAGEPSTPVIRRRVFFVAG
jgi:hypothetical protein